MHPLHLRLADGPPAAIGEARAIAAEIADDPDALAVVVEGLAHDDVGVRNRAAWALDRASRRHPDRLAAHVGALLEAMTADRDGNTLRRLLPLLLHAVPFDVEQARRVHAWALHRLDRVSIAEHANLLDTLASVAIQHPGLAPEVVRRAHASLDHPAPAARARARYVCALLDRHGLTDAADP